ncbi:MAG: enoyl-CoA hydratase/isomerase family protein [Deltaproteobacteria bacterium]|nr:enoyl-CoA hydratase/isomerase family protein [Deltaproteobacteria bacterium]
MSYQYLLFDIKDKIALVTFNRPESLNALNLAVMEELDDILNKIRVDESIAVVVLTGAGEKAFIAGADIKEMVNHNPLQARNFTAKSQEVILKLEALPQPVIAAVNGFCLGGGCEIAMGCDFIYASEKAKFGQPEITLGIIPGFGGTQRLARLVGKNRAKEMCLTGELINAGQALAIGLANKIFPPEALMDEVMKTAKNIAGKSRVAVRAIKNLVDRGIQVELRTALAMEVESFGLVRSSVDAQEGLTAFIEKRKPNFDGSYNK